MKITIQDKIESLKFIISISKKPKTDIEKDRDKWKQELLESYETQLKQEQEIKDLKKWLNIAGIESLDSAKEKELFYLDLMDNCVIQQEQVKGLEIELLDLKDTNLMFGEIHDMQIDKIKDQEQQINKLESIIKDITDSEVIIYLSENMRNRIKEILN